MSVEVEKQIFARITGPELTRRTVHQQSNFLICLFIKKINYFKNRIFRSRYRLLFFHSSVLLGDSCNTWLTDDNFTLGLLLVS